MSLCGLSLCILLNVVVSVWCQQDYVKDQAVTGSGAAFYCHGKSVGNYKDISHPCSHKYFSCLADGYPATGIRRSCPDNLYFNEKLDKCLEREFVPECEEMEEEEESEFEHFFRLHNKYVAVCRLGQYEHPDKLCSPEFIECDDRTELKKRTCPFPEHLRFDKVTGRCLEAEMVPACNPEYKHTDQETDHKIEDIQCPHEGTHFVAHPSDRCTGEYYACVDGQAFTMRCPRNLLFDEHSMQCQSAQHLPYCHEHVAHLNLQVQHPVPVVPVTHTRSHVVVPKTYLPPHSIVAHPNVHVPQHSNVQIGSKPLYQLW